MDETEKYIRSLLLQQGIDPERQEQLFREFVSQEENSNNVKSIRLLQEKMTKSWQLIARREEIKNLQIALPNGIAGKPYKADFDLKLFGLEDLTAFELSGFEGSGLGYDSNTNIISGTPQNSGDIPLVLRYNFDAEPDDAEPNTRKVLIIINPDPKSLWKNLPSDTNDQFAKADDVSEAVTLLGRTLLVSSKRGRSHANKGSFRDDDYAYAELDSGWGIIAVADGAGSAAFSRKGSAIACNSVVDYFRQNFTKENTLLIDEAIAAYAANPGIKERLLDIARPYLSAAAKKANADIEQFADSIETPVNDFHATLAFALVKQYPQGYAFFGFGVGDCPVALADKNFEWVKPLNRLDVGEFGGGTRFITMPEVFKNENFEGRFYFEFVTDFPYLVLMTDGIYDPKFEVEANLVKPEKWKLFFDDLQGNNSENANIDLNGNSDGLAETLSQWMDFWSPGNHDDRTLTILF